MLSLLTPDFFLKIVTAAYAADLSMYQTYYIEAAVGCKI